MFCIRFGIIPFAAPPDPIINTLFFLCMRFNRFKSVIKPIPSVLSPNILLSLSFFIVLIDPHIFALFVIKSTLLYASSLNGEVIFAPSPPW